MNWLARRALIREIRTRKRGCCLPDFDEANPGREFIHNPDARITRDAKAGEIVPVAVEA